MLSLLKNVPNKERRDFIHRCEQPGSGFGPQFGLVFVFVGVVHGRTLQNFSTRVFGESCDADSAHFDREARFQLGNTFLRQNRHTEATEQLQHSLRIARAAGDGVREALVLIDLGIVAERLFTSGLQIAREMGLRMFEGRALRRMAEFYVARKAPGDSALALEHASAALAILVDSEDAWAADRARETLREAETAR